MQTATVKSTATKEGTGEYGPWKNTMITCVDGAKIGTFEDVGQLNPGDEFEFEPELKGKNINIKKGTFKFLKANPNPRVTKTAEKGQQGKSGGGYKDDSPEKRRSIEGQVALIQAIEWTKFVVEHKAAPDPIKITDSDILGVADRFYNWLAGDTKSPQPPSSTSNLASASSLEAQPATSSHEKEPEATGLLKEALKCGSGTGLATFAGKHGIDLRRFEELVGCNPVQVKDVPAAAKVLFKED